MTVEIISTSLVNGICTITAIDCSEENLQRIERMRDDGFEQEVIFIFDTTVKSQCTYICKWLKAQKATIGCKTYGEALHSVCGTVTSINKKYRGFI